MGLDFKLILTNGAMIQNLEGKMENLFNKEKCKIRSTNTKQNNERVRVFHIKNMNIEWIKAINMRPMFLECIRMI